jgi:hypothetical protein
MVVRCSMFDVGVVDDFLALPISNLLSPIFHS